MAKAAQSLKGITKEKFLARMRQAGIIKGVCGEFSYREVPEFGSYFQYPVALYKVQNGSMSRLEKSMVNN